MKLLMFTDFHAHLFMDYAKFDPEYVTDRFKHQIDVLTRIFEEAREQKAKVIFGGDLFHERGSVDVRVFNKVWQVFSNYSDVDSYLIRGNHDSFDNSMGSTSSLDTFNSLPHCHVITEPTRIQLSNPAEPGSNRGLAPVTLTMLPYGEDIPAMKDFLLKSGQIALEHPEMTNILVAHIGVDGATQGAYSHRLSGAFSVDDLSPKAFDLVYLGHYHNRQQLAGFQNVLYGGSTIPNNFNDENQTKGLDWVTIGDNTLTREFEEIKSPKFVTVTKWDDQAEELAKENNYLRLRAPKKDVQAFLDQHATENTQQIKQAVRVEPEQSYEVQMRMPIEAQDSPVQITKKYVEEFEPDAVDEAVECITQAVNERG